MEKRIVSFIGTFGSGKTTVIEYYSKKNSLFHGKELFDYIQKSDSKAINVSDDLSDLMLCLLRLRDNLFKYSNYTEAIYDQDALALLAFQFSRIIWGLDNSYEELLDKLTNYYSQNNSFTAEKLVCMKSNYEVAINRINIRKMESRDTDKYFCEKKTFFAFELFYQQISKVLDIPIFVIDTSRLDKQATIEKLGNIINNRSKTVSDKNIYNSIKSLDTKNLVRIFNNAYKF